MTSEKCYADTKSIQKCCTASKRPTRIMAKYKEEKKSVGNEAVGGKSEG